MPADLARVKELFLAALEMPAPERAAYLSTACGGDTALRRQIEAMLQSHENSGELLPRSPAEMLQDGSQNADGTDAFVQQADPAATWSKQPATEPDDLSFLTPSARPGQLGQLGPYEVQKILGKGGFGVVLKGFDERLHRVVAIKVLSPAYAANGSARKRFIREARAAAAVKNEHVVGIHDVQDDAQPPYLVMEYIDGISLQDKIDRHGALDIKQILRIGMQIAEGLAAAHAQGLVHRDIKPANILLENGVERVKITDFGLARAVDDASVTQSGTVAGTPMYMSPEQAEGLPVDHRSDLFSLGTVMYAMCTGHPPFRASGTHAVLKRVIDASPRPIRDINNEIPDWLCAITARLHAKKPEERVQSANEVAELLGQRLADLQAGRGLQDEPSRVNNRAETPAARASIRPPAQHGSTRRRRVAIVIGLVGVVALAWCLHPYLLLLITNSGRLWISGKNAMELQLQLSRDGEVVKEFKGLGFQGFDIEPGEYVLKAVNPRPGTTVHFSMQKSSILSGRAEWKDADKLSFAIRRGESVEIEVGQVIIKGTIALAKPFFFDQNGLEKVVITSAEIVDGRIRKEGSKVAELKHELLKRKDTSAATLAPGWYKVEVVCQPGYRATKLEMERNGQRYFHAGRNLSWRPLELKAGDQVTIQVAVEKTAAEPDWAPLFNGKDLTGWKGDTGDWQWKNDQLVGKPMAQPDGQLVRSLWSTKVFEDFELQFQARLLDGEGQLVVYLRNTSPTPAKNKSRGLRVEAGERQWGYLLDDAAPLGGSRALAGKNFSEKLVKAVDFNDYYIRCLGNRVTVHVNGALTVDAMLDERFRSDFKTNPMPKSGFLGFEVRGGKEVAFRQLGIRELPRKELGSAGAVWVQLFNGKDLTGWKLGKEPGAWRVVDNNLVSVSPKALASTGNRFSQNFHFRTEVKPDGGRARFSFRNGRGLDVSADKDEVCLILRLPDREHEYRGPFPDAWNKWIPLDVIVDGGRIDVKVDGQNVITKFELMPFDNEKEWSGPIVLSTPHVGSELRFRKVEIKETGPFAAPENVEGSWVQLFNGKNLDGWTGDSQYWSYRNQALVGICPAPGVATRMRLTSKQLFEDFELRFEAKETGGGWGVIEFRKASNDNAVITISRNFDVIGAGDLAGSGVLAKMRRKAPRHLVDKVLKKNDFNQYSIKCVGKRLTAQVNGVTTVDEEFPMMPAKSPLGLIIVGSKTAGETSEIQFRNMEIRRLPPIYKDDKDRLQGSWVAVSVDNGRQLPQDFVALFSLTIAGNKLTWRTPWGLPESVFHLNESTRPKQIDMIDEDRHGQFGIYRFEGDRLVVCVGEDDEKERPMEFSSKGGKSRLVVVFKRVTESEPGWVHLFNAKDLAGWKADDKSWRVTDGLLTAEVPRNLSWDRLTATRPGSDNFHLRLEGKLGEASALSVFFHLPAKDHAVTLGNKSIELWRGFEKLTGVEKPLAAPGKWFQLDLIAEGPRIRILMNGDSQIDYTDPDWNRPDVSGPLVIRCMREDASKPGILTIKKIEIKERPPAPVGEAGWVPLFNGKDLSGWVQYSRSKDVDPKQVFLVEGNVLMVEGRDKRCMLRTEKVYENYELEFDFRVPPLQKQTAGCWLLVHTQPDGIFGNMVQIDPNGEGFIIGPDRKDFEFKIKGKPAGGGAWNRVRLTCKGDEIGIRLNGEELGVAKCKTSQFRKGFVAIWAEANEVHYRNIRLRELPPREPGWVQLFNGKDLVGWAQLGKH
jgi:uncharacterized protein (TIGR03067 family)